MRWLHPVIFFHDVDVSSTSISLRASLVDGEFINSAGTDALSTKIGHETFGRRTFGLGTFGRRRLKSVQVPIFHSIVKGYKAF